MSGLLAQAADIGVWGLLASACMATILEAARGLGLSRLSIPFLAGSVFTGSRPRAHILGYGLYTVGGVLFACVYQVVFAEMERSGLLLGATLGLLNAAFLLIAVLPVLPYFHPRMASEHDGPEARRRLEPPGFLALHYGAGTPLCMFAANAAYGAILGFGLEPRWLFAPAAAAFG